VNRTRVVEHLRHANFFAENACYCHVFLLLIMPALSAGTVGTSWERVS
jgi:steroid 5-alpha reductase family enzyme